MNSVSSNLNHSSLSELFHYNPSKKEDLQKGLREYQFLLTAVIKTHETLENGDLQKFDSLVGENACQTRAIKIALLVSKHLVHFDQVSARVQQVKTEIDELLTTSKINGISLQGILDQNHWNITLTPEEQFCLLSYVLSQTKEQEVDTKFISSLFKKDKVERKNLQQISPQITTNFTNYLIGKFRKLMAESSVQFVRDSARDLQDESLQQMVSETHTYKHHNWLPCTPMFWTYKTLLKTAAASQIPLVVHAKFLENAPEKAGFMVRNEEYLLFKPSQNMVYEETAPTAEDLDKPACVIQGVVCPNENGQTLSTEHWKAKMASQSIVDVILAGAADHRQYPDPNKQVDVKDLSYENYKKFAEDHGCSLKNPTFFFIQHVYAAKIGKMPGLASKMASFSERLDNAGGDGNLPPS